APIQNHRHSLEVRLGFRVFLQFFAKCFSARCLPGLSEIPHDVNAPMHVRNFRRSCCNLAPIFSTADLCQTSFRTPPRVL
ncbi:hypothetical protein glysoja_017203, partial [Glycine soja]